ncbi:MAG TPA: hypothetical protein VK821_00080 [Dehalococcoidia bacterium]|nr:hypothetical protein [Dehalococcoidia bacterium]
MQDGQRLEGALARSEADADALLKAASILTSAAKRFRTAAQVGNLRELQPAIAAAESALAGVARQFAMARDGWDFAEEDYLGSGSFVQELLDTAERSGVRVFERDDRLYSYPVLVRVLANERAVQIDRTRYRRLRPSVLVNHLRDLQRRPPRFRPEAFLEALYSGYLALVLQRGKQMTNLSPVEELLRIYDLLTLFPGQSSEYSRQEFARDVYLLDRSGVTTTRRGYVVSLPASTGTRSPSRTLRAIAEDGEEKVYYGIAFARPDPDRP